MKDHGGVTRSATAGVQTHTVFQGYTRHTEGIGVAKILLGGEGQLADISQRLDVVRSDAQFLKLLLVELVVHAVANSLLKTLQLEGLNLFATHSLEFGVKKIRLFHHIYL